MIAEAKVGILFLVVVVLAVGTVTYLSGRLGWMTGQHVSIHYENVEGLSEGAKVLFSGMEIGRVLEIRMATAKELLEYPERPIVVEAALEKDVLLKSTDKFIVTQSGLLGDTHIAVRRPTKEQLALEAELRGEPPARPEPIGTGTHLVGDKTVGITELGEDARGLLAEVKAAVQSLREVYASPQIQEQLPAILANVEQATGDAVALAQVLSRMAAANEQKVGHIASQIAVASNELAASAERVRIMIATGAPNIERATGRVARMIESSAGSVEAAAGHMERTGGLIVASAENIKATTGRVSRLVDTSAGDIEATARSVRSASATVDETIGEARQTLRKVSGRLDEMVTVSSDNIEKTTATIERTTRESSERLQAMLAKSAANVEAASEQVAKATTGMASVIETSGADITKSTRRINEMVSTSAGDIEKTTASIERATRESAERLQALITSTSANLEAAAKQVEKATTDMAALVESSGGDINKTTRRISELVETSAKDVEVASGNLAKLSEQMHTDLAAVTGRARQMVDGSAGNVEATTADLAATAKQLRADLGEVSERTRAMIDQSAGNIEKTTSRVAQLTERSAADIEATTRRIHDLVAMSPIASDLAAASGYIRRSAENVEVVTRQARTTIANPDVAQSIDRAVKNLATASDHIAAMSAEGAALVNEGRKHISDEQMWSDVRTAISKLRQSAEDIGAITAHGRQVLTAPAVAEDLTATLASARRLTESGADLAARADETMTRINSTVANVQGLSDRLQPSYGQGYASIEGIDGYGLRADVIGDFYYGDQCDVFWRLGVRDLGDSETFILQRGLGGCSDDQFRAGVYGNKIGVGYDTRIGNSLRLELDTWDPDDLKLDARFLWRLGEQWDLTLGASSILSGTDPFVGIRRSARLIRRQPTKADLIRTAPITAPLTDPAGGQ